MDWILTFCCCAALAENVLYAAILTMVSVFTAQKLKKFLMENFSFCVLPCIIFIKNKA